MLRNVYCGTYFTPVQTCNVTRVQSATEWTASVHTLHMSFFFWNYAALVTTTVAVIVGQRDQKERSGTDNTKQTNILYTCPNL